MGQAVAKAEDEYMPSGPPMSPLTGSYFWMWALYDLRIGKSTDTVAYCQIAVNDVIQMNALSTGCRQEAGRLPDGDLRAHRHGRAAHPLAGTDYRQTNSSVIARPGIVAAKGNCGMSGSPTLWSRSLRSTGSP